MSIYKIYPQNKKCSLIKSKKCMLKINLERKEIDLYDLTLIDVNYPVSVNTNTKSIKKAIKNLEKIWHKNISIKEIIDILLSNGIKMTYYN